MVRNRAIMLILLALLLQKWSLFAEGKGNDARLTVFAAASLNEAFREIAKIFNKANPDIALAFSFAGSQQLVQQLNEGAPADVFASADLKQMDIAVKNPSGFELRYSGSVHTSTAMSLLPPGAP